MTKRRDKIRKAAKELGITEFSLLSRIARGASVEEACIIPRHNPGLFSDDLTGIIVPYVAVIKRLNRASQGYMWLCKCKLCGDFFSRTSRSITKQRARCGCLVRANRDSRKLDIKEKKRNKRPLATLTFDGRTQPVITWAKEWNISSSCLRNRLRLGHTEKKYLSMCVWAVSSVKQHKLMEAKMLERRGRIRKAAVTLGVCGLGKSYDCDKSTGK
jgi:hypothetical protein